MFLKNRAINNLPKEVWIGWIASLVEAYNMSIYSFMAPFLAVLLFKGETEWNAVFFSYALVFMGSSLLYPLGAVYYGSIGDREGRQKTCIYSTLGLGVATGLMGLIPYHACSDKTWILFLLLIGGKYFFSGGEYYGSIVFSLEHAEEKCEKAKQQNGLMSGLSCLFAVFGLAAANGLASWSPFLSLGNDDWGIRVCFLLGGAGGILSYYLKNYCQETPAFKEMISQKKKSSFLTTSSISLFELLKREWSTVLSVVLVWGFFSVAYGFIFIFLPLVSFSEQVANFDTFKSLIFYGLFLVLAGFLADKIGIQKQILIGLGLFGAIVLPICYMISEVFYLQLVLTPIACLVIAPIHSWMLDRFIISERCRGMFVSSAISMIIFGGSAVPICLKIYEFTNSLVYCALYPLVVSVMAFLSILLANVKPVIVRKFRFLDMTKYGINTRS